MNIFTNDDYRRIQAWLKANAVKDSEFDEVSTLKNTDYVTIIGTDSNNIPVNYKILIKSFINSGLSNTIIDNILAKKLEIVDTLTIKASDIILPDLQHTLQDVITDIQFNIGNLETIKTKDKSNIVNAVNEVYNDVDKQSKKIDKAFRNVEGASGIDEFTQEPTLNLDFARVDGTYKTFSFPVAFRDTSVPGVIVDHYGLVSSSLLNTIYTISSTIDTKASKEELFEKQPRLLRYQEDYVPRRSPLEPIKQCAKIFRTVNGVTITDFEASPYGGLGLGNNTLTFNPTTSTWYYHDEELATKEDVKRMIQELKN